MPVKFDKDKIVADLKKGFKDIQTVAEEGNLKLFVKQFVAVLVVFLLFRYCNGQFADKISNYNGQMDAIRMQQTSEQEYQANKKKLMSLEPRFPDVESKNEWLLSQVLGIFKEAKVTPQMEGTQREDDSNASFLAASLLVNADMSFDAFANLLAGVENKDECVKISSFSITKQKEADKLGMNRISMQFNTVFPKEKVAKSIFKDYDKLVEQQQAAQKKPQAEQAAAEGVNK